jgi:hypothetical protein
VSLNTTPHDVADPAAPQGRSGHSDPPYTTKRPFGRNARRPGSSADPKSRGRSLASALRRRTQHCPPELHADRRQSHPLTGVETRHAKRDLTPSPRIASPAGHSARLGRVCGGSTLPVSSEGMRIHRIG